MHPVVLDTNVVLDAYVFDDPRAKALPAALAARALRWLATPQMRDELERVLAYPQIVRRLAAGAVAHHEVLAHFDRHATLVEAAPPAPYRCKDPDDQKFIDLAVQHRALLLSKDREVLKMKNRLLRLGCPAVTPAYVHA